MARSSQFSAEELKMLLSCLENMRGLIDGGNTDSQFKTPSSQKQGWEEIALLVNSVGAGTERSAKSIKNKWLDLKYRTKRKAASLKNEFQKTGGGPPSNIKLSEMEEKILSLIGRTSVEGITPMSYDSTAIQLNEKLRGLHANGEKNLPSCQKISEPGKHGNNIPTELSEESEIEISGIKNVIRPSLMTSTPKSDKWFLERCSNSDSRLTKKNEARRKRRRLDNSNNVEDVVETQKKMYEKICSIEKCTAELNESMSSVKESLASISSTLNVFVQAYIVKNNIEIVQNE